MTDNPHYVTLLEAQRKLCPMSMNRKVGSDLCINSDCMAWRWQVFDKTPEYTDSLMPPPKRVYEYSTTNGYCGVVGEW